MSPETSPPSHPPPAVPAPARVTDAGGTSSASAWIGVVASLGGVLLGGLLQYFVTYKSIERPKLALEQSRVDLERKRASLEGHKLAMSLTPLVDTRCSASPMPDSITFRIDCSFKNSGFHHVQIAISDIALRQLSDTSETLYPPGTGGYLVHHPNKKKSFQAPPGVEGDLWFYVVFDKQRYPQGVAANQIEVRVGCKFQTPQSVQQYVIEQFPELKAIVEDASTRGSMLRVSPQQVQNG